MHAHQRFEFKNPSRAQKVSQRIATRRVLMLQQHARAPVRMLRRLLLPPAPCRSSDFALSSLALRKTPLVSQLFLCLSRTVRSYA